MESRAFYALTGMLTLAVLALALGFAYWVHTSRAEQKTEVRLVFTDKVSGLGRGSSVLFNGVNVGDVARIDIDYADPRQIAVIIQVSQSTPLRVDTRARLEAQGVSGGAAVQLIGGKSDAAMLVPRNGELLPTIFAEPTQDILDTVRTYTRNADTALDALDSFLKNQAGPIIEKIKEAEQFTAELADKAPVVQNFILGADDVTAFATSLGGRLEGFSYALSDVIRSLDRTDIGSMVEKADKFTAPLGNASNEIGQALRETASIAEKLNRAADGLEGVLQGAQQFLDAAAGKPGQNAFSNISDVARSIRALAINLDKRSAEITGEIVRFSRAGLRGALQC